MTRSHWAPATVANVSGPQLLRRTYLEQRDLRSALKALSGRRDLSGLCEVGAGYGRMTGILTEFGHCVTAFEREPELCAIGRRLIPEVVFTQVETFSALPGATGQFDLTMTFTVLQHLTDYEAQRALSEIERITCPGGFIILCEHTGQFLKGTAVEGELFTIGRSIATYSTWLPASRLETTSPRVVQPDSEPADVGHFMIFERASGESLIRHHQESRR